MKRVGRPVAAAVAATCVHSLLYEQRAHLCLAHYIFMHFANSMIGHPTHVSRRERAFDQIHKSNCKQQADDDM